MTGTTGTMKRMTGTRTNNMCYEVWNDTDQIPASDQRFKTKKEAEKFCEQFRDRIERIQGYYLTSSQERIPLKDVKLVIVGNNVDW